MHDAVLAAKPAAQTSVAPLLVVRDLNAWYGESHALHGVTFDVRPGEVVTLLGRNGAGKTTTLKAIMGILPKRTGSVTFEGRETIDDVAPLGMTELRVPESALIPLEDGEFYWYQYVGAPVETVEGDVIGRVIRVEPTGGAGMLVVEGPAGEVQVPLVRDLCPTLTPERIVVKAPEGLIELNVPTGRRREDRHRHDISEDGGGGLRGRRHRTRRATRPA